MKPSRSLGLRGKILLPVLEIFLLGVTAIVGMVNAAMESVKALEPDPTGRFIPYVVRDTTGAGIHVEPLAAHDKEGDGDYDLVPQKTLKPAIAQGETL